MEYLIALEFIGWLPIIVIVLIICAAFGRRRPEPPPPRRPLLINGRPVRNSDFSWTRVILALLVLAAAGCAISWGR
jgi:hypothetical protein